MVGGVAHGGALGALGNPEALEAAELCGGAGKGVALAGLALFRARTGGAVVVPRSALKLCRVAEESVLGVVPVLVQPLNLELIRNKLRVDTQPRGAAVLTQQGNTVVVLVDVLKRRRRPHCKQQYCCCGFHCSTGCGVCFAVYFW